MMTYRVTKTINGKQYVYEQTSYRVGKRVKTKSKYLGPVGRVIADIFTPIPEEQRGLLYIERLMEKYPTPAVAPAPPAPAPVEKAPTEKSQSDPASGSSQEAPAEKGTEK